MCILYTYVCLYTRVQLKVYIHVYVYTYIHISTCTYIHVYMNIYVQIHMYKLYVGVYICTYICMQYVWTSRPRHDNMKEHGISNLKNWLVQREISSEALIVVHFASIAICWRYSRPFPSYTHTTTKKKSETKPIFTNLKEKIRAYRASSELLDYFLRSNKSNINQSSGGSQSKSESNTYANINRSA